MQYSRPAMSAPLPRINLFAQKPAKGGITNEKTMKIYWIGTIVALMITGAAHAQHTNIGIKGGLNVYNIYNDDNSHADAKVGFHTGLVAHVHLSDQFAFQPELVYSVQGTQFTVLGTEVKQNLNYLNVPLLLQYMFDKGFRLQAGPQLGLLLSAKSNMNNSENDIKNNYEDIDWGVGMGMSYINPASGFGIDVRYNLGLTDINASGSVNATNRGFQAGVFYMFDHK